MSRTGLAAVVVVGLLAGHAAADDENEYFIDEYIPLPRSGIVPVSLRAGPVEITELRVRNIPRDDEVRDDTRRRDMSHPKPIITAVNHGTSTATITMMASLEDGKDGQLMRCTRRPQELDAGRTDDWNICSTEALNTADWPLVSVFHVSATIRVFESAPNTPAPPPVDAGGRFAIPFASAKATAGGGEVSSTKYSEHLGDVTVTGVEFADGVVTLRGQVGLGQASRWAGVGVNWYLQPRTAPVDASRFRSVTFRLASSAKQLRIAFLTPDPIVRMEGCSPEVHADVTPGVTEVTIPFNRFRPQQHCSSRFWKWERTLSRLAGFEVVSTAIDSKPVFISVGETTLNP